MNVMATLNSSFPGSSHLGTRNGESRDVRLILPQALRVERPFCCKLMNANFVFPRPQPGLPRPRPARAAKWSSPPPSSNLAGSRDSNALRASILDTALELGIGSNSVVTNWMFSNPLMEEPEDAVSLLLFFFRVNYSRAPQVSLVAHCSVCQPTMG